MTKAKKISAPRDRNKLKRPKPPDQEQYERFRQAARELGTDESEEAFERAFRKIVPAKSSR